MSFPFFLAHRLSINPVGGKYSTGIVVAVTGIALSIVVMLISISVLMGFQDEVRRKFTGFDSQVTISRIVSSSSPDVPIVDIDSINSTLALLPEHASYTLTIRQPSIIKTSDNFSGVVIKGMDKNHDWDFVSENLKEGVIPDYKADSTIYHIIISDAIASSLNLNLNDKVDAYFLGENSSYRTRRLKIAGIYDTHFSEYDKHFIFSTISLLQQLGDIDESQGTVVEITGLGSDKEIDDVTGLLTRELTEYLYRGQTDRLYSVSNVHESAAIYFNWLALLDTNVVVILSLMAMLGALTLISSLFILILRRVPMIGILKALGATDKQIRLSFVILTLRILIIGLLIGNITALTLIFIQHFTHILPLNPDAYYLDHVPVAINFFSILILNLSVIVFSFLILIVPSSIISTISPSRAICYK
ncbi:MAG: FtsX-like permease family protein [Muribaculum sp.]|nr:FtsX-like permease family protein [Muribaculum sp.]